MKSNPYPFHLEKDYVDSFTRFIKLFIKSCKVSNFSEFPKPQFNDHKKVRESFEKHFRLLDSYSSYLLEVELSREKMYKKLSIPNLESVLQRKYFSDPKNLKVLKAKFTGKELKQDAEDISIPSLVGQAGITEGTIQDVLETNVGLISNLEREHLDKIKTILSDGLTKGLSYDDIAKRISEATGSTLEKAKFWATDQSGKFFGEVTRKRQMAIGYPGFIWVSIKDSKVRPTHLAFEGHYYDWDKGTGQNHRRFPGEDYRCRCFAKPAFPEDVEAGYQQEAEIQRWDIQRQSQNAQREFDKIYNDLKKQAEETPYAEKSKDYIPSKIQTTDKGLQKIFMNTTKDFTSIFQVNTTKLDQNEFRSITRDDIEKYKLKKDTDGKPLVSGIFVDKDNLIAINLGETNKHITSIHEMAHWMYNNYPALAKDPEILQLISNYKDKFTGKIKDEKYYLGDSDIFSRFIEYFVAEKKGGIYKEELEMKRKMLLQSNNFKVDLFDQEILDGITKKLGLILKRNGLIK